MQQKKQKNMINTNKICINGSFPLPIKLTLSLLGHYQFFFLFFLTSVNTDEAVVQDRQGTTATGFGHKLAVREAFCKIIIINLKTYMKSRVEINALKVQIPPLSRHIDQDKYSIFLLSSKFIYRKYYLHQESVM